VKSGMDVYAAWFGGVDRTGVKDIPEIYTWS